MAAQLGTDDDDGITGINVTPLVDIMLVLLIIFMVASSYITKEAIGVNLPKAATGEESVGQSLAFKIAADGTLYMDEQPTTREQIAAACGKVKGQPNATAMNAADSAVPHGRVTALIDFVRQNGVANFAINITPTARAEL